MNRIIKCFFIFSILIQHASCIMTRFLRCVHKNNRTLDKDIRKYVINLDDAICFQNEDNYRLAIPYYENIKVFNELYEYGHEINYWTCRGVEDGGADSGECTKKQLHFWGVKYDALYIGENDYDVIIDKRAYHIEDINSLLKK